MFTVVVMVLVLSIILVILSILKSTDSDSSVLFSIAVFRFQLRSVFCVHYFSLFSEPRELALRFPAFANLVQYGAFMCWVADFALFTVIDLTLWSGSKSTHFLDLYFSGAFPSIQSMLPVTCFDSSSFHMFFVLSLQSFFPLISLSRCFAFVIAVMSFERGTS